MNYPKKDGAGPDLWLRERAHRQYRVREVAQLVVNVGLGAWVNRFAWRPANYKAAPALPLPHAGKF